MINNIICSCHQELRFGYPIRFQGHGSSVNQYARCLNLLKIDVSEFDKLPRDRLIKTRSQRETRHFECFHSLLSEKDTKKGKEIPTCLGEVHAGITLYDQDFQSLLNLLWEYMELMSRQ